MAGIVVVSTRFKIKCIYNLVIGVTKKRYIFYVKRRKFFRPNCIAFGEFAEKCIWQVSANSPNGEIAANRWLNDRGHSIEALGKISRCPRATKRLLSPGRAGPNSLIYINFPEPFVCGSENSMLCNPKNSDKRFSFNLILTTLRRCC